MHPYATIRLLPENPDHARKTSYSGTGVHSRNTRSKKARRRSLKRTDKAKIFREEMRLVELEEQQDDAEFEALEKQMIEESLLNMDSWWDRYWEGKAWHPDYD